MGTCGSSNSFTGPIGLSVHRLISFSQSTYGSHPGVTCSNLRYMQHNAIVLTVTVIVDLQKKTCTAVSNERQKVFLPKAGGVVVVQMKFVKVVVFYKSRVVSLFAYGSLEGPLSPCLRMAARKDCRDLRGSHMRTGRQHRSCLRKYDCRQANQFHNGTPPENTVSSSGRYEGTGLVCRLTVENRSTDELPTSLLWLENCRACFVDTRSSGAQNIKSDQSMSCLRHICPQGCSLRQVRYTGRDLPIWRFNIPQQASWPIFFFPFGSIEYTPTRQLTIHCSYRSWREKIERTHSFPFT